MNRSDKSSSQRTPPLTPRPGHTSPRPHEAQSTPGTAPSHASPEQERQERQEQQEQQEQQERQERQETSIDRPLPPPAGTDLVWYDICGDRAPEQFIQVKPLSQFPGQIPSTETHAAMLRPPLTPAPKVRDRIEAATQAEADHIVPCVNSLLMAWPPTVFAEQEQAPAGAAQALVDQAVATVAVIRPFLWEMLPPELQTLVVSALFGHADQVSSAEEAAQMQGDFAHSLRASKGLYETVVPHFKPVFFCALRLAPMGPTQLLGTPLHRLLGPVEPKSPQANYPLILMLQAMAAATARLPSDKQMCQTALVMGKRVLQALSSPQATAQDRRTLLLMPIFIVQALRARLHKPEMPDAVIASTMKELSAWAITCEPDLALPLLLELFFTASQLQTQDERQWLSIRERDQLRGQLEVCICQVGHRQGHTTLLIDNVQLLLSMLPDPWDEAYTPNIDPQELTQVLAFLANYPFALVGFASEALKYLQTLAMDEQQAGLLKRCQERQQNPLDRPSPRSGPH